MNIPHKQYQIFILFFSILLFAPIYTQYDHAILVGSFENKTYSRDITENTSHYDYSHDKTWNNSNFNSLYAHKTNFSEYTVHDFQNYFTAREYAENQILNQRCLYMFDEFVKFAQTYSSYKYTIQQIHAELKNFHCLQKSYYIAKGTYCAGLQKRIRYLYNQLNSIKDDASTHKEPIIYNHSVATFPEQQSEYKILDSTYRSYIPSLSSAIEKRIDTYNTMTGADYALHYASKSYNIHNNVKQLLYKHGYDTSSFAECYGNQLHHAIHQESLNLLERINYLSPNSILYDHQEALIDFTVAMVDYNHEGLIDKAINIGDLCWTLLDYGQAIAEGAALGVYSAVRDILTNPIEATVCIVAGKQVLAYQLCKVLYNVTDIGLTALTNTGHAKKNGINTLSL